MKFIIKNLLLLKLRMIVFGRLRELFLKIFMEEFLMLKLI